MMTSCRTSLPVHLECKERLQAQHQWTTAEPWSSGWHCCFYLFVSHTGVIINLGMTSSMILWLLKIPAATRGVSPSIYMYWRGLHAILKILNE
jgi:hypothetical protein